MKTVLIKTYDRRKKSVTSPYVIHREKLTVIARRHCKSPNQELGAHISCRTHHALGRGSYSYLFLARFTDISSRSTERRAALLLLKIALQRPIRHCPRQRQRTDLSSHHATLSFSFISSSFITAVLLLAFARQGGNFKRLKKM